ncbi:plasmid partitioning protein RepB C-terminal domain-containing protein [Candidatus Methylobacter oryzae]|uniref:ParB/RepB/Spo0J family partition protein n=1 Tax=Candidatus Methylobacter oryzae TaxID=2497749 RepID=A0ABY3CBB2_9GAMM|nr:plasmid partitioning protein RepB C-terminal domain-containing protein [Candidatus Methylobacter oryzae]TRW95891.1 ParB/RepB/Spo0J family partition protein [Candidatus Methylobacter oryzae]
MSKQHRQGSIQMIPLDCIVVLNPRERNHRQFEEIVGNIKAIGLKKPITVTPRPLADGKERFLLICGEGRLKAYQSIGEPTIPAFVVQVNDEDAFIMSLAENIARRQCRPLELLAGIKQLRDQGYDKQVIAQKTGLSLDYVKGILTLLEHGEERLLVAVENGRIPLNTALEIARVGNEEKNVQIVLQELYESGQLRGKQLIQARRIVMQRQSLGRSVAHHPPRKTSSEVTTNSLVRSYQKEVDRQKLMVKKAEFAQQRLLFVAGALRQLFADENFTTLLRAEALDTLPTYLAERVWPEGH